MAADYAGGSTRRGRVCLLGCAGRIHMTGTNGVGAPTSTPASAGSSPQQFTQGQFDHAAFDKSKFGP
jgi:hypothetical protein